MNQEPVKSSNIQSAGRDGEDVVVTFKGGASYRYKGVPETIWNNFRATFQSETSSGKYLNQYIKRYPWTKL